MCISPTGLLLTIEGSITSEVERRSGHIGGIGERCTARRDRIPNGFGQNMGACVPM